MDKQKIHQNELDHLTAWIHAIRVLLEQISEGLSGSVGLRWDYEKKKKRE